MGKHSIRGVRSGNILNVVGKDDPRKIKKHRKLEGFMAPANEPASIKPPLKPYEGWMEHWDPMADLERILEQDRQRRKRQAGY